MVCRDAASIFSTLWNRHLLCHLRRRQSTTHEDQVIACADILRAGNIVLEEMREARAPAARSSSLCIKRHAQRHRSRRCIFREHHAQSNSSA